MMSQISLSNLSAGEEFYKRARKKREKYDQRNKKKSKGPSSSRPRSMHRERTHPATGELLPKPANSPRLLEAMKG